jgi:GWxTD domain-containing protein
MILRFIILGVLAGLSMSSAKNLSIDLDFGTYNYKNNKVIWELYYSFPDTMLTYKQLDNIYHGELKVDFKVKYGEDLVLNDNFIVPAKFLEKPDIHKNNIYGMRAYEMNPGEHLCSFKIKDLNTGDSAQLQFKVNINGFDDRNVNISDLQLAKLIVLKDSAKLNYDKMFLKNNYYVIPNPSYIIDREPYELRLYYEIYNAKKYASDGINIKYTIYDGAKREVFSIPTTKPSYSDFIVNTIKQPISMLPTGTYFVDVEISYPLEEPIVTINRQTKFFLINKYVKPELVTRFTESATFEKSEFSSMDNQRLDSEYRQIKLIANKEEVKSYELLNTVKARQRFLYQFWKNRDIDTNSSINVARRDFIKAIDFANMHFRYGLHDEGWNTDRGRVLLKYGFPDQREIHVSDGDLNAYEEWFYNDIQGGAKFIFVDKQGFNDFLLVHSDVFGEVNDYNWFDNHVLRYNMQNNPDSENKYQDLRNGNY